MVGTGATAFHDPLLWRRGRPESAQPSVEVEIRGLSIYTHHGVTDAEQEVGQRLEFDLTFDVPDCDAVLTDRVEDTVDYSEVCDIVALAATEKSYRTLERLCQVVAGRLMERFDCESVQRARGEARAAGALPGPGGRGGGDPRALPGPRVGRRGGRLTPRTVVSGYLGLGSNVGDRESHLRRAIEDLRGARCRGRGGLLAL